MSRGWVSRIFKDDEVVVDESIRWKKILWDAQKLTLT